MTASVLFSATLLASLHLSPAQESPGFDHIKRFKRIQTGDDPLSGGSLPGSPPDGGTGGAVGLGNASGGTAKRKSKAACFTYARGFSAKKNDEAVVQSVVDVSAYVCGPGPKDPQEEEKIAQATATAFALAISSASVECAGEGDVAVYGKAYAKAVAEANVWLKAYAEAFAEASTCDKECDAAASSFGYVEQEVYLKAVAESEATVERYNKASEEGLRGFSKFVAAANDFDKEVKTATVTAFAKAIAGAKKYHEEKGCFAWVNAGGCIWTPSQTDPDFCVECTALSVGATKISEIDAMAEAVTAAAAFTCGNDTEAKAESYVAASSIAEATAEAISFAYANCTSSEGSYGCSASIVAAKDTAIAVAEAFATSWAGAYNCEETCVVETESVTTAIGGVLVQAVTDAFASVCAANGETWSITVLAESIEKGSVEAVAEAIANAVSDNASGECAAATGTFTAVE